MESGDKRGEEGEGEEEEEEGGLLLALTPLSTLAVHESSGSIEVR